MSAIVQEINPQIDPRWDDFVAHHPSGRVYHHSTWARVIQSTYGHRPFYLAVEDPESRKIKGVAPFFIVKSWITGERVVSLPFATYCDPLATADNVTDMLAYIYENVPKARHIKMKLLDFSMNEPPSNAQIESSYVTHMIDLRMPLDDLFNSFHESSVKQRIRRAERSGISFRVSDSRDDLRSFYCLFGTIRKRHGLPPHPLAFFENLWNQLKPAGLLELAVVEHKKRMIAGSIVLKMGATYHHEYSASEPAFWKLCSNQMLLWEIIKMAHADQASQLDLGRTATTQQSLIEFKERWHGKPRQLAYCTMPMKAKLNATGTNSNQKSVMRKCMEFINHRLPSRLLEWEGRTIYPHVDG